ncbi:MAG: N-acetylmuramoyl-L-alanine amidase [Oscillospiraceae bacterium]|nr:N-acetylmuramoyl-L-alanine amidase [Oscillospiraceae bacterium]
MERTAMYAPVGSNCRPGYTLIPQYITIHNTANRGRGADAAAHGKYLQNGGKDLYVSYHYAVDDRRAVAIIPENEVAWHAGDGAQGVGNRRSFAIEICENCDGDLEKATENAVELTRELMQRYKIPLENVVTHQHWSGKVCPNRLLKGEPFDWQTFLAKVEGKAPEKQEDESRRLDRYRQEREQILRWVEQMRQLLKEEEE